MRLIGEPRSNTSMQVNTTTVLESVSIEDSLPVILAQSRQERLMAPQANPPKEDQLNLPKGAVDFVLKNLLSSVSGQYALAAINPSIRFGTGLQILEEAKLDHSPRGAQMQRLGQALIDSAAGEFKKTHTRPNAQLVAQAQHAAQNQGEQLVMNVTADVASGKLALHALEALQHSLKPLGARAAPYLENARQWFKELGAGKITKSPPISVDLDRRLRGTVGLQRTQQQIKVIEGLERYYGGSDGYISLNDINKVAFVVRSNARHPEISRLTNPEIYLINNYSREIYEPLNKASRQDFDPLRSSYYLVAKKPAIDDGNFLRLHLQAQQIIDQALAKLPDHKGIVYRGMRDVPVGIADLAAGDRISFPGLLSTARNKSAARGFSDRCLMVIHSLHGKSIDGIATQTGIEAEVMFASDTPFRILKIRRDGHGVLEVHLKEIERPKTGR